MSQYKVREIKVWQLVKEIEEGKETDSRLLGEMKATLLVNFGENGVAVKGLIQQSNAPLQMMVKVLQYLMDEKNALNKIDEGKSERTQPNVKVRKKCHCDKEEKTCSNCGGWY